MSVHYEWDIETVELEHHDVLDHDHSDVLDYGPELLRLALAGEAGAVEDCYLCLVLVRDVWDDVDGVTDRQWAYVEDGALPETFDGGAAIPQRFRKELAEAVDSLRRGV